MKFRPMPVLTVFTLASLIILIMLGNWQYSRYSEKLARVETPPPAAQTVNVEIDTSNPGNAQQVYGITDGESLWRRYVPGRINGEGPVVLVLWDAVSSINPVPLKISDVDADYSRVANVFFRPVSHGGMSSQNAPEKDTWYRYDPEGMVARLGYDQATADVVESVEVTVRLGEDMSRARRTGNGYANLEPADPLPPERHFGYALTWWGMAIGLLGVYFTLHHSRGRLKFRSK